MPMLIRLTSDSSSSSSWKIRRWCVSATPACAASASMKRWSVCEKAADPAVLVARVDQLQHADQFAFVVAHRHRQERLRMVVAQLVELDHAGEVEDVRLVDILDVDGQAEVGRIGRHRAEIFFAVVVVQRHAGRGDRLAVGAALVHAERVVEQDVEIETLLVLAWPIQGAAVGVGHALGDKQDALQQRFGIVATAQLDT
jgi:hypothetical protein